MLTFDIAGQIIELDLLATEAVFVGIENACHMVGSRPTALLLDSVADWLASLGVHDCTRTAAWQVWWAVYERIDHLRKAAQVNADLAFWYHIDPFGLTEEQRVGLIANLPRVKAQSTIHVGKYDGSDYEYVYQLTLLATDDINQARRARGQAMELYVDSKMGSK